jgi:hypothetical protein
MSMATDSFLFDSGLVLNINQSLHHASALYYGTFISYENL